MAFDRQQAAIRDNGGRALGANQMRQLQAATPQNNARAAVRVAPPARTVTPIQPGNARIQTNQPNQPGNQPNFNNRNAQQNNTVNKNGRAPVANTPPNNQPPNNPADAGATVMTRPIIPR